MAAPSTRRRDRDRGVRAAGPRFRGRPGVREARAAAGRTSARSTTSPTTPTCPQRITIDRRHRRGRQDRRSTCAGATRSTTRSRRTSTTSSSRSRRAACTSAARCASSPAAQRFICPCHGGVYDFDGKVAGGPPVRPLDRFYTRSRGAASGRPALQRQQRARSASRRAIPARRSTASASTSTRRVPTARKIPGTCMPKLKLPKPPIPHALNPRPSAPATTQRRQAAGRSRRRRASRSVDWVDERTSLSGAARWMMFRKVPQGDQLVLHARLGDDVRLPRPGGDRRLPGDVLPTRRRRRRVRVDPLHQQRRFLGEFVHGMHKWGSIGDGDPRLPAHGEDVLLRRLQVPARAELGHRRRAADPDDA